MPWTTRIWKDTPRDPASWGGRIFSGAILASLLALLCWSLLAGTSQGWPVFWKYRTVFWQGWMLTVGISAVALVSSLFLGILAALARRSSILIIRYLSTIYIEFVRGMPLLVLILVLFYGMPQITQSGNRLFFGVLALSLFSGAYMAEIVRSGIESVGASQRESARAIGLTTYQTYAHVIFPQALRHTLPALTGQFASLIKDSSLLSVIGLTEFTFSSQQVFNATYSTMESFLPLAAGYLILTLPISFWTKRLESRLRYET